MDCDPVFFLAIPLLTVNHYHLHVDQLVSLLPLHLKTSLVRVSSPGWGVVRSLRPLVLVRWGTIPLRRGVVPCRRRRVGGIVIVVVAGRVPFPWVSIIGVVTGTSIGVPRWGVPRGA